jgi:hypothetical protein
MPCSMDFYNPDPGFAPIKETGSKTYDIQSRPIFYNTRFTTHASVRHPLVGVFCGRARFQNFNLETGFVRVIHI